MNLTYPVCLYPEETGFTVVVPDLPGCVTQGDSMSDALLMAIDAASLWVLDELESGRVPPPSSELQKIKADEYPNGVVSVILLDMDAYSEKYGKKAVRKNCTIPAWLNTAAEENQINFSGVLQEALVNKLELNR